MRNYDVNQRSDERHSTSSGSLQYTETRKRNPNDVKKNGVRILTREIFSIAQSTNELSTITAGTTKRFGGWSTAQRITTLWGRARTANDDASKETFVDDVRINRYAS